MVVFKLDRAFRSTKDALATVEKLDKLGRDFVSVSEKIDTTSAVGKLFFTMISAFAQFERDTTSERTTAVLNDKRSRCEKLGGPVPYGFTVREMSRPGRNALKILEPQSAEQAVIDWITELKSRGCSLRGIAKQLDEAGHPNRTGTAWSHKTVARILKRSEV